MNESAVRYLMSLSEKHCSRGLVPEASLTGDIYVSHSRDWDARKGEELIQNESTHPLLKVQVLLFAGRFHEANDLLREVVTKSSSNDELAEFYLEAARLAAYEGQWQSSIDLVNHALELGPCALSALTLHQIRSVAHFEMGSLASAIQDIEKINDQCRLFPFSSSKVYGEVLRVRILARDSGTRASRTRLDLLWTQLISNQCINRDNLLALVRAEIDLARLMRKDHLNWALASYALANAMGDRLYLALALRDIYFALPEQQRHALDLKELQSAETFGRIRLMMSELKDEAESTSQSTVALKHFLEEPAFSERSFEGIHPVKVLVIPSQKLSITIDPMQTHILPNHKQLFDAAHVLNEGPIVKDAFFMRIWNGQQYVSGIHDILIRRVLYRLRKYMGVNVTSERLLLKIHEALLV